MGANTVRVKSFYVFWAMLGLLLPVTALAFDLGAVVDDVGRAVKSGAAAVEEGV